MSVFFLFLSHSTSCLFHVFFPSRRCFLPSPSHIPLCLSTGLSSRQTNELPEQLSDLHLSWLDHCLAPLAVDLWSLQQRIAPRGNPLPSFTVFPLIFLFLFLPLAWFPCPSFPPNYQFSPPPLLTSSGNSYGSPPLQFRPSSLPLPAVIEVLISSQLEKGDNAIYTAQLRC